MSRVAAVEFQLMPIIGNVKGICRFYLKQTHPRFQLYVSPINIDPEKPALPISTPSSYSRDLARDRRVSHARYRRRYQGADGLRPR